jgi:hypothetical protein
LKQKGQTESGLEGLLTGVIQWKHCSWVLLSNPMQKETSVD